MYWQLYLVVNFLVFKIYSIEHIRCTCFYTMKRAVLSYALLHTKIWSTLSSWNVIQYSIFTKIRIIWTNTYFLRVILFIISCCKYQFYRSNPEHKLQFFKQNQYSLQPPHAKANWNLPPRVWVTRDLLRPGQDQNSRLTWISWSCAEQIYWRNMRGHCDIIRYPRLTLLA